MIEILVGTLLGVLLGTISGLIPGVHVNTLAGILLSLQVALLALLGPLALAGALFAALLWEISKHLFDIYIKDYAGIEKIYGSFGTIVILLFWIYYSAFILLIGAEIGASLETLRKKS